MRYETITDANRHVTATMAVFSAGKGVSEYQLMIQLTEKGLPFPDQLKSVFSFLEDIRKNDLQDAVIVFRRVFLSDAANQLDALLHCLPGNRNNLSIIEQPPLNGAKIALWTYLQTGVDVSGNHASSGLYGVRHGKYLHLWKGAAISSESDSGTQMTALLDGYMAQLAEHDCTLAGNCIRTWIFVRDIDVHYAGIVKARRERFAENGLTGETHYIASTGIGGRHADPAATVVFDAYAVKGLESGQIRYLHAKSHLNVTHEYGVTFERGTCIRYGDRRHVFISGTASIDNRGKIVHEGDAGRQAARMIENVNALLGEAGCGTDDIAHIIVYLRDMADYTTVGNIVEKHFPDVPKLILLAPICRPGWLVEMECFAIGKEDNVSFEPL
jgi:enamine deaminase RidA (YjgF/YER057c/UK114 family)